MSDTLKVIVKKKFIPTLVEFCLDESLEFNVKLRLSLIRLGGYLKNADIKTAVVGVCFPGKIKLRSPA